MCLPNDACLPACLPPYGPTASLIRHLPRDTDRCIPLYDSPASTNPAIRPDVTASPTFTVVITCHPAYHHTAAPWTIHYPTVVMLDRLWCYLLPHLVGGSVALTRLAMPACLPPTAYTRAIGTRWRGDHRAAPPPVPNGEASHSCDVARVVFPACSSPLPTHPFSRLLRCACGGRHRYRSMLHTTDTLLPLQIWGDRTADSPLPPPLN